MIPEDQEGTFEVFQDALSPTVIARLSPAVPSKRKRAAKGRKNQIKPVRAERSDEQALADQNDDAAELADFVEYLARDIFLSLPAELRTLSWSAVQDDASLLTRWSLPLDASQLENLVQIILQPSTVDSLVSYRLVVAASASTKEKSKKAGRDDAVHAVDAIDLSRFLEPILSSYIESVTAPPPEHTPTDTASRPDGCEICSREHLPLTYHHLIPRQIHAKAVKRGWAKEYELAKVAWLCRACHSFVHKIATNEELAREWNDVDLLLSREDVQRWAGWVGRVRWKAR